jgi:hypothetical protein
MVVEWDRRVWTLVHAKLLEKLMDASKSWQHLWNFSNGYDAPNIVLGCLIGGVQQYA